MAKQSNSILNFEKHKGVYIMASYIIILIAAIIYIVGASISPTGQVILSDTVPKKTFGSIIFIVAGFGVALGILVDFLFKD